MTLIFQKFSCTCKRHLTLLTCNFEHSVSEKRFKSKITPKYFASFESSQCLEDNAVWSKIISIQFLTNFSLVHSSNAYSMSNSIEKKNPFVRSIISSTKRRIFTTRFYKNGETEVLPLITIFLKLPIPKLEFITLSFNMFPVQFLIR